MKKIALVLTSGLLGACSMLPNKNVAGTYQGELPCSDCDKIQAELVLNADNTYQYNTVYFKNGNIPLLIKANLLGINKNLT